MIQEINVNIMKTLTGVVYPQYYNTSGAGLTTFTTPDFFETGSTVVFVDSGSGYVYQAIGVDYTENSGNQSITFGSIQASGSLVEIRYNKLIVY